MARPHRRRPTRTITCRRTSRPLGAGLATPIPTPETTPRPGRSDSTRAKRTTEPNRYDGGLLRLLPWWSQRRRRRVVAEPRTHREPPPAEKADVEPVSKTLLSC